MREPAAHRVVQGPRRLLRIARLSDAERARGVVAASAGNHAQGVAFAAGLLGCAATVVMPEGAPLPKVLGDPRLRSGDHPARQLRGGRAGEALAFAERTGAVLIHPYDHPDIVAGQGTLGFEIIEQCPQVRTVVIPVGGGGLAAGCHGGDQGPRPGGRRRRRPGRGGRALPGLAGGRAPGPRCRPRPPWPTASRSAARVISRSGILSALRRRVRDGVGGEPVPGAAAVPGAGQAGGRARRCGRRGRPAGARRADSCRRWWPCSPAATSTRCCCRSCSGTASTAAGRYLAFRCRLPDRPGSARRACSPTWPVSAPTCSRSGTSG